MSTHSLNWTPMVQRLDATTTYTDYVNCYKSVLQTTSFNLSKTETTREVCAGVVKTTGVYRKNSAQHFCDLTMLEKMPGLKPEFVNPQSGVRKQTECIRIEGAGDEGPSHKEVKFLWTVRHLEKGSIVTVVITRSSGSGYLTHVELQKWALDLAHSNVFIPSTLGVTYFSNETRKVDRVTWNMDLVTNVYISPVNKHPCGETAINMYMYKRADPSQKEQ